MPARLPTLGDDHIHPNRDGPLRLVSTADGVHNNPAGVVDGRHIVSRIGPHERHDPQSSVEGLIKSTVVVRGQDEVAPKRPIGESCRFTDYISGVVGPRQRHHAEAARVGDRGG